MSWAIYKHTLLAEDSEHYGWSYIGQTSKANPARRWGKDGNGYQASSFFYAEIQKYGWEAFSHEILEDLILTQADANKAEQYWIAYYRTFVGFTDCKGYNLTPGGNNCQYRITNSNNESLLVWDADLDRYFRDGWRVMNGAEYKKWFRQNSDAYVREKQIKREKYNQNIETERQKQRDYYADNSEKIRQRCRDNYAKNGKERYQNNKANRQASNKAYYDRIKDTPEYKKKHAEANKRWREKKLALANQGTTD